MTQEEHQPDPVSARKLPPAASGASFRARWLPRVRRSVEVLTLVYFTGVLFLLIALHSIGERNWVLSLLLYLPPQVMLLPLLVLAPLALAFSRRAIGVQLLPVVLIYFGHFHWRWASWSPAEAGGLKVLTNNIGERKTRTLWPFLKSEQPDIFGLQEAFFHDRALSSENPGKFVASRGEFVLVSAFPVQNSGLLRDLHYRGRPVAAWFKLDYDGESIVVYNVHLPTPRPDFERLRGRGFLFEAARGGGIYSAGVRETYRQALSQRNELAAKLVERIKGEEMPCIVMGDFNMPEQGYIYKLFARELTDAFAASGRGYGLTFPGVTRNPLSFFGPWLRLDYVFVSPHWTPVYAQVEPRQNAQHRAVAAKLQLQRRNAEVETTPL